MIDTSSLLGGYTPLELQDAFNRVAPKPNWKLPICATLPPLTSEEMSKVSFAITYYTGSVARIMVSKKSVTFTAAGYYSAVGA